MEQQQLIDQPPQYKKVQAENMRLKKRIYELEKENEALKLFIGGK